MCTLLEFVCAHVLFGREEREQSFSCSQRIGGNKERGKNKGPGERRRLVVEGNMFIPVPSCFQYSDGC